MKALIMAAGYATRLYPLTLNTPKPLLKIGKKLMVEHILDKMNEVDEIDEIFIVTNDRFFSNFVEWLKTYDNKKQIKIINDNTKSNEDRLGAVGDIDFVIKKENIQGDFLIVAGDNIFEFSLKDVAQMANEKRASVVAAFDLQDKSKLAKKFGTIEIDSDNKIIGFEEKPEFPKSSLAATCCYVLKKEDVEEFENCIREHRKPDNAGDFVRYLSQKKPVYCFVSKEHWTDIGGIEELKAADEMWSKK